MRQCAEKIGQNCNLAEAKRRQIMNGLNRCQVNCFQQKQNNYKKCFIDQKIVVNLINLYRKNRK